MADTTRFPQGVLLTGTSVAVPAPVGTIKQLATGQLVVSLSATVASYGSLNGGLPVQVTADPGDGIAIPVTRSTHISFTSGGVGETGTLAVPTFVGQLMSLELGVFGGGARVVTAANEINQTPDTIMTFGAAADWIILMGVQSTALAFRWRVVANNGVGLA